MEGLSGGSPQLGEMEAGEAENAKGLRDEGVSEREDVRSSTTKRQRMSGRSDGRT